MEANREFPRGEGRRSLCSADLGTKTWLKSEDCLSLRALTSLEFRTRLFPNRPWETKEICQLRSERLPILHFAFPNDQYVPIHCAKFILVCLVASNVAPEFPLPIGAVVDRRGRSGTTMSVPKTSVDENGFSPPSEHDIRPAWKLRVVQSVSVTQGMQEPADLHLRCRAFAPDPPHSLSNRLRRFRFAGEHTSHDVSAYFIKALEHWRPTASAKSHGKALPTMSQAYSIYGVSIL